MYSIPSLLHQCPLRELGGSRFPHFRWPSMVGVRQILFFLTPSTVPIDPQMSPRHSS